MKPSVIAKSVAAIGFVASALGAAPAAHARGEVYFYVEQPAPRYVQPAPVYVHPSPRYVHPAPVYVQPHHGHVAPGYGPAHPYRQYRNEPIPYGHHGRGSWGDRDRDGIANVHDHHNPFHHRRLARDYGPFGDIDGDGIMNQDDRDRDGDGVRNRYDRFPDDPYRY